VKSSESKYLGEGGKTKMTNSKCQKEKNLENCTCTYPGCPRKGKCCECIEYHKQDNEIPACLFPKDAEKAYDRSINNFTKVYKSTRPRRVSAQLPST
jgi:hypothetical protein